MRSGRRSWRSWSWAANCDAPDEEDGPRGDSGEKENVNWIEDEDDDDDVVLDMEGGGDEDEEEDDGEEEDYGDENDEEEDEDHWEEEFEKAVNSSEAMEKLVKRSVEVTTEHYKQQMREMVRENEKGRRANNEEDGDETQLRGKRAKVSPKEWKLAGIGPWRRRIKKSKIPPELFLRAAVRPFTYRNLVKEIVLTRHAIIDGDISADDKIL